MQITDLPDAVRRMFAYRAALELLGFNLDEIFVVSAPAVAAPLTPLPPGHFALGILLMGIDGVRVAFPMYAGPVAATWWNEHGPEALIAVWNALPQVLRAAERQRWVSAAQLAEIVASMASVNIVPPALAARGRN